MTKRETGYSFLGLKVWATAGLMLILVLSSGLALASSTKYKVYTLRYENKGAYLASPMVVFLYTSTVKCQMILRTPIANGELASYNLERKTSDQGSWKTHNSNEPSCPNDGMPVEGSEVWMRVNIEAGDNVNCRKDGTKYFYYKNTGTVKYVTKGYTHSDNHCSKHSPDSKWIFD